MLNTKMSSSKQLTKLILDDAANTRPPLPPILTGRTSMPSETQPGGLGKQVAPEGEQLLFIPFR